ncbi:bifunctional lysylphosphatidylglycerol flippase/synthetase MprF [Apilactobacillus apisilvae]|uniref:Bifunctional lysylphosphatidylglycerol flippase/synthetase MprF n=2 Tax=Apilactobacillus apisilvae TaxID=2923364 RepID=A0ABY4PK11_9LACO|nr:bifunctional lysylphosphatidylglycerol flippase/synthetase MprF [Apilactobacillus apisilvae]UQS85764.1 bifunctional lysylphosphatidylglycerol flippase/synthetase MprF [Apilactobacillus apisilvae]
MTIVKILFVIFVLFVVIDVGIHETAEISGAKMAKSFSTQTPMSLFIMMVLGFVSVLPMLIYDFTIVGFLPGKFKKSYVAKTGWITNTLTNIAGFGGVLGASLRANFYSKNATKKQILYAISKIVIFLLAGLSSYCWIALIMMFLFGFGTNSFDWWWWIVLILGGLYFPLLLLITRKTNLDYFKDLNIKVEMKLIIGSLLEWLGCSAFFIIIGLFMHQPINLFAVFPVFIVANVVGVASLIPGGLGSFDSTMMAGLLFLGVSPSSAAVWLLLYRAFYYIFPVALGIVFFVIDLLQRLNNFLDDIPKVIFQRLAHVFITIFMYFSGIMMLLVAVIPNLVLVNKFYLSLEPYTFYFLDQLTTIIVSFLLIGFARGFGSKVKKAFWPTTFLLTIAIGNTLWKEDFPINMVILSLILIVALWLSYGVLYREKFTYSWGHVLIDFVLFGMTFIVYALIGLLTNFKFTKMPFHLANSYLFPSPQVWFAGFLGLILACLILILTYRYLSYTKASWIDQSFDSDRVSNVITAFGGNEVSHLAYVRDKDIYFYQENDKDQLFFMYKRRANKIIIMGEPIGNMNKLGAAVDQFINDSDNLGYSLVFYEIGEELTMLLHEKGFSFTKAGEEGHVVLSEFSISGKKHRGERALMNKFDREEYKFEIIQPPFSNEFISELKYVSDQWLKGNPEKGFSLGYFDRYYLSQAPIAVMKDKNNKIVAFANIMPTGDHEMTSIDLMRSSNNAPSGIMDGLFINLFDHVKKQGYKSFNLGMAPLSNVGESRYSFIDEKISNLIYQYGTAFYSFQGLRSYKEKYVQEWAPKYVSYRRGNSLVFTMLQLLMLVNEHIDKNKHQSIIKKYFK